MAGPISESPVQVGRTVNLQTYAEERLGCDIGFETQGMLKQLVLEDGVLK